MHSPAESLINFMLNKIFFHFKSSFLKLPFDYIHDTQIREIFEIKRTNYNPLKYGVDSRLFMEVNEKM